MRFRSVLLNFSIIGYLGLTICALSFTLFRSSPLPISVVSYFYGMIAPYQGYSEYSADLKAEGLKSDGAWEAIDLTKYFPVSMGERTYRMNMQTARNRGRSVAEAAYENLKIQLKEHEGERGHLYSDIRLTFDVWPTSPAGFAALRLPAFTTHFDPLDLPE